MTQYSALFFVSPEAFFGLPQGNRTVVRGSTEGITIVGPVIDLRTFRIVSHGTLSSYRTPEEALDLATSMFEAKVSWKDNFLTVEIECETDADALSRTQLLATLLCQCLSVKFGERFQATLQALEADTLRQVPIHAHADLRFDLVAYDIDQLADRIRESISWVESLDESARKALLYFEHALLLKAFAANLDMESPHATFSHALAFLQLYKGLSALVGDPGTDRDYQRRATKMGLPKGYWADRVKPLYLVRSDHDVAHYSLRVPEAGRFHEIFRDAVAVFQEVLAAHLGAR
jgi:hypothetical protein